MLSRRTGYADIGDHIVATIARFGVVGLIVTALNYAMFLGLLQAGVPHMLALMIGWVISVALGFVLNRRVTFNVDGGISKRELAAYATTSLFQLALALAGFWLLIDRLSIPAALAYPINLAVITGSNFILLRCLVFPRRGPPRLTESSCRDPSVSMKM